MDCNTEFSELYHKNYMYELLWHCFLLDSCVKIHFFFKY